MIYFWRLIWKFTVLNNKIEVHHFIFEIISLKNEFDWSPWSACTKTCGFGSYRTRERTCSLFIPEDLRKVCISSDIQKVPCNVPLCSKAVTVIPNTTQQQGNAIKTSEWSSHFFFPVVFFSLKYRYFSTWESGSCVTNQETQFVSCEEQGKALSLVWRVTGNGMCCVTSTVMQNCVTNW